MAGKAKPAKHTAKEIALKHHEAKMKKGGRGGGLEGMAKRVAPKEGKKDIFLKCQKCLLMQPSLKSMQIHYENKHPKEDWESVSKLYDIKEDKDDQTQSGNIPNADDVDAEKNEEPIQDEGNEGENNEENTEKEEEVVENEDGNSNK